MPHLVLLGDSIFDNAAYVPGEPPVIDQLRASLPDGWRARLLAVDGAVLSDVAGQLRGLPADATHLGLSAGGNDALRSSGVLGERSATVAASLLRLGAIHGEFARGYRHLLGLLAATDRAVIVCTIYDAIPGLDPAARAALALFNDVILREAFRAGADVVDLRLTCDDPRDYSPFSPIEPSAAGGLKIARVLAGAVLGSRPPGAASTIYA